MKSEAPAGGLARGEVAADLTNGTDETSRSDATPQDLAALHAAVWRHSALAAALFGAWTGAAAMWAAVVVFGLAP
jgi:hypothetical protein